MELYEWQPAGVEFLRTRPGGLLADEQGLGKTVMFIEAAKKFSGPVLCIVRGLAKLQTSMMIKEWDPGAPIVRCVEAGVFAEDVVREWFKFPRTRGYLLVHHEAVYRIAETLRSMGVWDIIWVDEAHRISNPRARVTKAVKSIPAFYKWGTSGTIMDRSPADFWSILNWFDDRRHSNYWRFHDSYVDIIRNTKGQVVKVRPKNLTKFAQEVGPYYLRRTAEEVGIEEPLYQTITLEMYPKQAEVYTKLKNDTLAYVERESTSDPIFVQNALQKVYLLQQATISTTLLDVPGPSVKYDFIQDWLEDYQEPVVIFTHSRAASIEIAGHIKEPTVVLNGETPNDKRDRYLELFKSNKVRVAVCVTDLAAESLSLSWVSNSMFVDIHPSSRMMSQAEMRIRRADSKSRAKIYFLLCKSTVDDLCYRHYREKLTNRELVELFLRRYTDARNPHQ